VGASADPGFGASLPVLEGLEHRFGPSKIVESLGGSQSGVSVSRVTLNSMTVVVKRAPR
jgi:hypothetical protein